MVKYSSEIIIAVGGKPQNIEAFAQDLQAMKVKDVHKILPACKIIRIKCGFSVFAFYSLRFDIDEKAWPVWGVISSEAEKRQLSYILCRLGENFSDIEIRSNWNHYPFDKPLHGVVKLHRWMEISSKITSAFGYKQSLKDKPAFYF